MTVFINRWNGERFESQGIRCDCCHKLATVWVVPVDLGDGKKIRLCLSCLNSGVVEIYQENMKLATAARDRKG